MAYPPNQVFRFPVPPVSLTLGASPGTTTTTEPFLVPAGMKTVTVWCPDMATSTALVLQGLLPNEPTYHTTQTWADLYCTLLTTFALVKMSFTASDNTAFTVPVTAMGGGIFRWSCADSQASTPLTVYMCWTRDG